MTERPKRRKITKKIRAEVFIKDMGRCYLCGEKADSDNFDVEHELALDLGGADDLSNYRVAHKECHRGKTRSDIKLIAKGRRIRRNLDPETRRKTKHPIPKPKNFKWASRPFSKREEKR